MMHVNDSKGLEATKLPWVTPELVQYDNVVNITGTNKCGTAVDDLVPSQAVLGTPFEGICPPPPGS